jgi:hypothetical protein
MENKMTNIKPATTGDPVLLSKEHDISAFVSNDESRYALNGIHYNAEKSRLEATDGRILITISLASKNSATSFRDMPPLKGALPGAPESCTFPPKALTDVLAHVVDGRVALACLKRVVFGGGDKENSQPISFTTTDLDTEHTVYSKVIECNYPDVEAVLPTFESRASILLGPHLLKKALDYATDIAHATSIKLELSGELHDAARISFTTAGGRDVLVALMPMRE